MGTAHFTLRLNKPAPAPFFSLVSPPIDDSVVFVIPPGAEFEIYYDPTPDQDFALPFTFSNGTRIASFRESALQGGRVLLDGGAQRLTFNLFSSELLSSAAIWVNGTRLDFKKLVPGGVTIHNFVGREPTFGGSAVAIGGRD